MVYAKSVYSYVIYIVAQDNKKLNDKNQLT